MSFERPTLAALVDRIESDFVSRLELAGAVLRRSVVRVLARVLAGVSHMLHGHIEFVGRQIFPDVADEPYLLRHASLRGVAKTPATYGVFGLTVTGVDATVVPQGSLLTSVSGFEYETIADATISGGEVNVNITATTAGSAPNLTTGAELSFSSPIPDVDSVAIVDGVGSTGVDQETTEEFRARYLERLGNPGQGGSKEDLINWSKEVSGVTRVWVRTFAPGIVLVLFARDRDVDAPFPSAGEVLEVSDYLNARIPAHMGLVVDAPAAGAATVIQMSITPDTTAMREAVTAQLKDLFFRAEPGVTIPLQSFIVAIGSTPGIAGFALATPAGDVVPEGPEFMPYFTSVTFT